ncbi:MAG: hypothetical protein ACI8RD_011285, partial [Bacillariaceae sp.]
RCESAVGTKHIIATNLGAINSILKLSDMMRSIRIVVIIIHPTVIE